MLAGGFQPGGRQAVPLAAEGHGYAPVYEEAQ